MSMNLSGRYPADSFYFVNSQDFLTEIRELYSLLKDRIQVDMMHPNKIPTIL